MYKIGIISNELKMAELYRNILLDIFKNSIEVTIYSILDTSAFSLNEEDLYLLSIISEPVYDEVVMQIKDKSKIVIAELSFTKKAIEALKNITRRTKCLLVTVSRKMAIESIAELHQNGVNKLEYEKYYPGCDEIAEHDIVITPNEMKLVPKTDKPIIDIGDRVLSVSTIVGIALKMGCEYILEFEHTKRYFASIADNNNILTSVLFQNGVYYKIISEIEKEVEKGIVSVDKNNIFVQMNEMAQKILGKDILGKRLNDVIEGVSLETLSNSRVPIQLIYEVKNTVYKVNITSIFYRKEYGGAILLFETSKEKEKESYIKNKHILEGGHIAKYTFSDIVGRSEKIQLTKKIGATMAKSNSPVMIYGESGTGKELFAQAIHNSSSRKMSPFVAVNCASLSDTLLDSELFGYGDGAFTGAKKGGKIGLFEVADRGTLFLDEIECMSPHLQAKLLRVLQEKEIMRIGSNTVKKIDVRIITATNEDVADMINKKMFRKDLYYRICTLPIYIPPLRDRDDDIFILIDEFKARKKSKFIFTARANNFLKNYSWQGNVRELQNFIEYIDCIGNEIVDIEDFPPYMTMLNAVSEKEVINNEDENKKEVLGAILALSNNKKSQGRASIREYLLKRNIDISEGSIRTILKQLSIEGYIIVEKGRKGSFVSQKAVEEFAL